MKKYQLSVLGVSKSYLKRCGEKGIDDTIMVCSGVSEGRAKSGVAVIIAGRMIDYQSVKIFFLTDFKYNIGMCLI